MEKLIVSNFLNIKHIEVDIGKINILIGPQAQGKSVVAKLVYFFQNFWTDYRSFSDAKQDLENFEQVIIDRFKDIFHESYWTQQNFDINYYFNQINVSIFKQSKNKLSIKIKHLHLDLLHDKTKSIYGENSNITLNTLLQGNFLLSFGSKAFQKVFFIPSGRSLSAFIKDDKFELNSFLNVDCLTKLFINLYNRFNNKYRYIRRHVIDDYNKVIDQVIQNILQGNYSYEQEIDWIILKNKQKIKLIDASSGQQEVLPILMILSTFGFEDQPCFFLIENPESNLFPSTQNELVTLMTLIYNITAQKHSFFITTHSPYILTAFNTLIQAGNTYKKLIAEKREHQLPELFKIVPEKQMLDIDELKVYSLQNGEIESIIEEEFQVIDANIIDEISNFTGN